MMHPPVISAASFDKVAWIGVVGRADFKRSPCVKSYGESEILNGAEKIVVDLEECTSLDSTFMGTLAGLAKSFKRKGEGIVEILAPDKANYNSLAELGLDAILHLLNDMGEWEERLEEIRGQLKPLTKPEKQGEQLRNNLIDAHQNLSDINEENKKTFANVMDALANKNY